MPNTHTGGTCIHHNKPLICCVRGLHFSPDGWELLSCTKQNPIRKVGCNKPHCKIQPQREGEKASLAWVICTRHGILSFCLEYFVQRVLLECASWYCSMHVMHQMKCNCLGWTLPIGNTFPTTSARC